MTASFITALILMLVFSIYAVVQLPDILKYNDPLAKMKLGLSVLSVFALSTTLI